MARARQLTPQASETRRRQLHRSLAPLCLVLPLAVAASAAAQTGGAVSEPAPAVTSVTCRTKCSDGSARAGSRVVLRGSRLGGVDAVTFSLETPAKPRRVSARKVTVRVPAGAISGPVTVTDGFARTSAPSPALEVLEAAAPKRTNGPIATALTGRKTFVDGARRPTLSYRLQTGAPAAVTVSVVNLGTHKVVDTLDQGTVAPGADQVVPWTGSVQGRYAFVVSAVSDELTATTAQAPEPDAFVLLGHEFPIRGKHDYGQGFGAGRGHQGVDVFAKCGTPLVAARGGTVEIAKYQARAGHYLVVDEAGSDVDAVYMHLREAALVPAGTRVRTGDPIGFVGDTGDADGCHLHFEEWSAPGWYTGGAPFDPLPDLKAWDALS